MNFGRPRVRVDTNQDRREKWMMSPYDLELAEVIVKSCHEISDALDAGKEPWLLADYAEPRLVREVWDGREKRLGLLFQWEWWIWPEHTTSVDSTCEVDTEAREIRCRWTGRIAKIAAHSASWQLSEDGANFLERWYAGIPQTEAEEAIAPLARAFGQAIKGLER